MQKAIPYATKIPPVMWERLRAARNSAAVSMPKPGGGAGGLKMQIRDRVVGHSHGIDLRIIGSAPRSA